MELDPQLHTYNSLVSPMAIPTGAFTPTLKKAPQNPGDLFC